MSPAKQLVSEALKRAGEQLAPGRAERIRHQEQAAEHLLRTQPPGVEQPPETQTKETTS